MIDAETLVFSYVATELRAQFPGIYVVGETVDTPAQFPAVSIIEADNSIVQRMRTSERVENAASVMFEVNIFSNKITGKKQQAKEIRDIVDERFAELGFARTLCNPITNLQDASIYRIVARYEGKIDKDFRVYQ